MLVQETCIISSGADLQYADQAWKTAIGQGVENECDRGRREGFVKY